MPFEIIPPGTHIDFIGKRGLAAIFSFVVITAGIVGLTLRGVDILDIDFRGGTSVHVTLNKKMETNDVRDVLGPKFKALQKRYRWNAGISGIESKNFPKATQWPHRPSMAAR